VRISEVIEARITLADRLILIGYPELQFF
jgi:hypothetical protein